MLHYIYLKLLLLFLQAKILDGWAVEMDEWALEFWILQKLSPMGVLLPRNLTGLCSNRALVLKSGRLSFLNVYLFVCLSRPLCSGVHVLSRASVRNFFFGVAIFMGKLAAMSTFHDKIGSTCAACEERCGLARTVLGLRFGVRHRRDNLRTFRTTSGQACADSMFFGMLFGPPEKIFW